VAYEIEVILMRQAASYLAMPIFVVDPKGDLIYFNEPAEALLGLRYEEVGEMPLEDWATVFIPTDEHGDPIPPEGLPLVIALQQHRPAHDSFWIRGLNGVPRHLSVTAFPLIGQGERELGAVAIFWEHSDA
jgi:PAS domain S-box-containing protein